MRSIMPVGLASLTGLLAFAPSATAQRISAEVVLAHGPVVAHVQVGDRPIHHYYRPRRAVIVERREVVYVPRTIVVHRQYIPRGRAHGWWRKEGYHRAVVWVGADGRYYDRDYDRDRDDRRGLRPVRVYERDGRYYDWDD